MYCNKCKQKVNPKVILIIRSTGHYQHKYAPMIKASCSMCGSYLKFLKQTSELISHINKVLESFDISIPNNYEC